MFFISRWDKGPFVANCKPVQVETRTFYLRQQFAFSYTHIHERMFLYKKKRAIFVLSAEIGGTNDTAAIARIGDSTLFAGRVRSTERLITMARGKRAS